jgi:hypothetical protein
VRLQRPRTGHSHPAGRADIAAILRFFGEQCTYGLRSIELAQGYPTRPGGRLLFGVLRVPGRIILYDQAPSPWRLPGRLSEREHEWLCRAGAVVEAIGVGSHTLVTWPGTTLRDFMLFDVLMHEVGHHLIQQYTGKRRARVVRTGDHEAFAAHFAVQCRLSYSGDRTGT